MEVGDVASADFLRRFDVANKGQEITTTAAVGHLQTTLYIPGRYIWFGDGFRGDQGFNEPTRAPER